jgi:hypothetical protein
MNPVVQKMVNASPYIVTSQVIAFYITTILSYIPTTKPDAVLSMAIQGLLMTIINFTLLFIFKRKEMADLIQIESSANPGVTVEVNTTNESQKTPISNKKTNAGS